MSPSRSTTFMWSRLKRASGRPAAAGGPCSCPTIQNGHNKITVVGQLLALEREGPSGERKSCKVASDSVR